MVTFQFVPYHEVEYLSSAKRIHKLLNIVKNDKIVIMQGQLKKHEEADLIELTMEEISPSFSGIELSVIYPDNKSQSGFRKLKNSFVNIMMGDRQGFTIMGPASVVKKIVKNPNKVELFTNDRNKIKTKSRRRR
jgi:hypothetical protein